MHTHLYSFTSIVYFVSHWMMKIVARLQVFFCCFPVAFVVSVFFFRKSYLSLSHLPSLLENVTDDWNQHNLDNCILICQGETFVYAFELINHITYVALNISWIFFIPSLPLSITSFFFYFVILFYFIWFNFLLFYLFYFIFWCHIITFSRSSSDYTAISPVPNEVWNLKWD